MLVLFLLTEEKVYGCDLYSREEVYYRQYRNFNLWKSVIFYINFYGTARFLLLIRLF